MKKYEKPILSVISLCSEDVLTESGGEKELKSASLNTTAQGAAFNSAWVGNYFGQ